MPIISAIGRKHPSVRALIFAIYLVLGVGSLSMIYPFMMMISGSTKSAVDIKDMDIVPRFLYDERKLYQKHMEGLFNEALPQMNAIYRRATTAFEYAPPPDRVNHKLVGEWKNFLAAKNLPDYCWAAGYIETRVSQTLPSGLREFKKYLRGNFGDDIGDLNQRLETDFQNWNSIFILPEWYLGRRDRVGTTLLDKTIWKFKKHLPEWNRYYFSVDGSFVIGFLQSRYTRNIEIYNRMHATNHKSYDEVLLPRKVPESITARIGDTVAFIRDPRNVFCVRVAHSAGPAWSEFLRARHTDLHNLNVAYDAHYADFSDVPCAVDFDTLDGRRLEDYRDFVTGAAPLGALQIVDRVRSDWEEYVRQNLNLLWIRIDEEAADVFHTFIETRYGDIAQLPESYGTGYASFTDVPLNTDPADLTDRALMDRVSLIEGHVDPETGTRHVFPVEALRIHSIDFMFRDHLIAKFGSIAAVNGALGTSFDALAEIPVPQYEAHYLDFLDIGGALKREFVVRNYLCVVDYMLLHGRGIVNTVIYCGLAILTALLINPMAAYAMSRYKMPSQYKILLFLMCTMAFPPMVTQIPNFLMLRSMGLLNTFAALVLPGMANGYSIFLLKGFFDSLPNELYEAATLDGAGEWRMFWTITMSLSKPILAVIALNAFHAAYANFMFAFITCQDENMWTLMVWLYQLQQRSGQAVMYASLIIAALPTFLVFVFCQNIIMRGIIVPSEK